jgi:anionic cell wall polymer biosynthesis LytR-Cps2A-Psr (LCP) family protein
MKNSKNKAFRSTFLIGATFIVVAVTILGGILYSLFVHANFDHFTKKPDKIKSEEIVKEEVVLDDSEPAEKIVYKTDTVYIERKCSKKHVEQIQSLDTSKISNLDLHKNENT